MGNFIQRLFSSPQNGSTPQSQADERRQRLSESGAAITAKLLTRRLDLNAMLNDAVTLVRETFPEIANTQIFLVDQDKKTATLAASTEPAAAQAISGIGVGSVGVIGRVALSGQSVLVRDTDEGAAYRKSAFLAGTRTELALPLRVGADTIGVLDLQSISGEAFPPEMASILETVANQIAVVIDNARLYAESQSRLAENQRLYEQARTNLREIERLNQQLIGGAWAEFLRSNATVPAYTIDLTSGRIEDAAEWTPTLAEASRRNQPVTREAGQIKTIALPISVRGQVIGAVEFEVDAQHEVGPDQITILQQILERLGLAAENARLLEEAQRLAQRESLVNEISARMQATTDVETVIVTAVQSLADALQAPRVSIRLGTGLETAAD